MQLVGLLGWKTGPSEVLYTGHHRNRRNKMSAISYLINRFSIHPLGKTQKYRK
jgi:hypothetical protein